MMTNILTVFNYIFVVLPTYLVLAALFIAIVLPLGILPAEYLCI